MTEAQREALRLFGVYTAGSFRVWDLSGPAKASCRAHILSVLRGAKVPQSKAGVNVLRDELYGLADSASGNCAAERESSFQEWARLQLA